MKIDAHLHLTRYESESDFNNAKDRLLTNLEENEISHALIIADNVSDSVCADTKTLIKLFENNDRIDIIGSPNLINPDENNLEFFDQLLKNSQIKGLKLFPGHDPIYPNDLRCHEVYKLCKRYDVPVIIHTGINTGDTECSKYNDPKYIVEVAQEYPDLKIVIAHFFWPKLEYCYKITESFNNIYFDASALADDELIELSGGINVVRATLEKTILNRPGNVMFGTDFPMCNTKAHVQLIESLNISNELKEGLYHENAEDVFKILIS